LSFATCTASDFPEAGMPVNAITFIYSPNPLY
jgi:hypothetical protein